MKASRVAFWEEEISFRVQNSLSTATNSCHWREYILVLRDLPLGLSNASIEISNINKETPYILGESIRGYF